VAETIEYEQFDQGVDGGSSSADPASQVDLSRLSEIPMELSVEIGRTHMTVGETLDLCVGSVVTLERLAGETADLLVNGSAIARGEVVVIDEQYGLRITEILDGRTESESDQPLAQGAVEAGAGAPLLDAGAAPEPAAADPPPAPEPAAADPPPAPEPAADSTPAPAADSGADAGVDAGGEDADGSSADEG
jgi:flagellar motor switch protein FliN/FliY